LLFELTHKEILQWSKKGARAMDEVEFLRQIQKEKGDEYHGIHILTLKVISKMRSTT
jgi:hypothetical protein